MTVYKFSNVSGFKNYQKYNDFLAGNPAVIQDKGSMYPLGVFTLSSEQSTITFSNIPQTYKHLQLRFLARTTSGNAESGEFMRFNNDSGATAYYPIHYIYGDGSTAIAGANGGLGNRIDFERPVGGTAAASIFGVGIIDILDYTNTNKNKVVRNIGGADRNGAGTVWFNSGYWGSTAAINRIDLITSGAYNFAINSSFALYGVQA